MSKVKYPDITVQLVGEDGNAAFIIGKVRQALRRQRVSISEQNLFVKEATSGDYDNVLITVMKWVNVE